MGKFFNLTLTYLTILVFLHVFGFIDNNGIIGIVLNPEVIYSGAFWSAIATIFSLVSIGGIIASYFVYQLDLLAISPFILWFAILSVDFLALYNTIAAQSQALAWLIIAPSYFIYLLSMIDYWRRGD